MPKGNWMYGDKEKDMISGRRIAVGRKPNYINNDKDEIVRIIEGKKKDMRKSVLDIDWPTIYTDDLNPPDTTGDPSETENYNKVLHDIVKVLKCIGMTYVWGCAVFVTAFIILSIYGYFFGIGG